METTSTLPTSPQLPADTTFAGALKMLRAYKRLSQRELSVMASVTKQYICGFEGGRKLPSLKHENLLVERLAAALGVEYRRLILTIYISLGEVRLPVLSNLHCKVGAELVMQWSNLKDDQLATIYKILKGE